MRRLRQDSGIADRRIEEQILLRVRNQVRDSYKNSDNVSNGKIRIEVGMLQVIERQYRQRTK
jgi:hypothetical protein